MAGDRAPRERRALQVQLAGPRAGEVERRMAPAQRVAGRMRRDVRQDRQRVRLHVPERVAVVAAAGQPLRGDRPALGARSRLEHLEDGEAGRLLERGVAVELDVRAPPEVVEVLALRGEQPVPARAQRRGQRRVDLVAHRRQRAPARPAVGEELHDPQPLALVQRGRDRHAREVRLALGAGDDALRPVDEVVHPGRDAQPRLARGVDEPGAQAVVAVRLAEQRRAQRGRGARVVALSPSPARWR